MKDYCHKIRSLAFGIVIFSISIASASENILGTCILYKQTPHGDYTKAFVPSYTEAQCTDLQSEYDLVQWVEVKDIKEVETQSKGCAGSDCPYPCLKQWGCSCIPGYCK